MRKINETMAGQRIYFISVFALVSFATYLFIQYPNAVFATGVPPHSGPSTYTAYVPGVCVPQMVGTGDNAYMCDCGGGGDGGGGAQ